MRRLMNTAHLAVNCLCLTKTILKNIYILCIFVIETVLIPSGVIKTFCDFTSILRGIFTVLHLPNRFKSEAEQNWNFSLLWNPSEFEIWMNNLYTRNASLYLYGIWIGAFKKKNNLLSLIICRKINYSLDPLDSIELPEITVIRDAFLICNSITIPLEEPFQRLIHIQRIEIGKDDVELTEQKTTTTIVESKSGTIQYIHEIKVEGAK